MIQEQFDFYKRIINEIMPVEKQVQIAETNLKELPHADKILLQLLYDKMTNYDRKNELTHTCKPCVDKAYFTLIQYLRA